MVQRTPSGMSVNPPRVCHTYSRAVPERHISQTTKRVILAISEVYFLFPYDTHRRQGCARGLQQYHVTLATDIVGSSDQRANAAGGDSGKVGHVRCKERLLLQCTSLVWPVMKKAREDLRTNEGGGRILKFMDGSGSSRVLAPRLASPFRLLASRLRLIFVNSRSPV